MIPVRRAPTNVSNAELRHDPPLRGESNGAWLARGGALSGILLLGGASLSHFRIRVAESHLRQDLLPSFWSFAGILRDGQTVDGVTLDWHVDSVTVPKRNGIVRCAVADFDDPRWFPNIAVLQFGEDSAAIDTAAQQVQAQRAVVDLPRLMLGWLGYIWGAGEGRNPFFDGLGIPSAAFVESVYALAGIELTPGLSAAASSPESIWQAAKWWRRYYEERAGTAATSEPNVPRIVPKGRWATRQRAAAVFDPDDDALQAGTRRRKRR